VNKGSATLSSLAEVALDDNTTGKAVQVVRVPLHHLCALRQVLSLIVDAGNTRLFV
jgi:hypothetical protein